MRITKRRVGAFAAGRGPTRDVPILSVGPPDTEKSRSGKPIVVGDMHARRKRRCIGASIQSGNLSIDVGAWDADIPLDCPAKDAATSYRYSGRSLVVVAIRQASVNLVIVRRVVLYRDSRIALSRQINADRAEAG